MSERPDPDSFLSGESGTVTGPRARARAAARDLALDVLQALRRTDSALTRLAERTPARSVLVTGCYVPGPGNLLPEAMPRLRSARHRVRFAFGSTGEAEPALAAETVATGLAGGKLQNVNRVLAAAGMDPAAADWTIVLDDDVALAPGFLDRFLAICEVLALDLAQPAQTHRSHAAWRLLRRRPAVARETDFVEIGPVTAFSRRAAAELLPFPDLRMGWGLDAHWAARARQSGWRMGVVDSLPVRHETRAVAATYTREDAVDEGRRFLAERDYVPTAEGRHTLAIHPRVPPAGRLRVLVVPKWYPWPERPFFGLFCREHARALARRHEVVVLASLATPSPDFAAWRLTEGVENGIRTLRVRYRRPFLRPAAMGFQLGGMLAALWHLRREGFRPDVVHAHVYQAAPPALVLGRLSRAAVVVTEHYTGFARGLVSGYDLTLARRSFEAADLVAPVSRELAERLRAVAPRARIVPVPNVVDTDTFHPPPAPRPRDGPARLLNVATLSEKKGHRHLLEALTMLDGDERLDIVGEGELHDELEHLIAGLGLEGRVRLLGPRPKEEVAALMREADLFVLPSLNENLPVVLIEAQASGLPAVATRVGGVPELAVHGTGELVEPANPRALAEAIERALSGRSQLDRGALAEAAASRYGYDAIAARWTAIYEDLLSSPGSSSRATTARSASSP